MEEIYYAFNPWWDKKSFNSGIPREEYLHLIEKPFQRKQIDVVIGSRRAGKTTFLKQLIKRCLDMAIQPNKIFYLALDNPQVVKTRLSEHLKQFRKMFMHPRSEKLYLFFDEVQESPDWEVELKALYDLEKVKIVCSGSTSSLIKRQGGKLTGRQIVMTIYPLTFREFLTFKGNIPSRSEDYLYERLLEEYMETGGYPENVLNPSAEYMNALIDDIIARDVVRLNRINRPELLKDLLIIIANAVGFRTSFNRIAKALGITVDTVKEYINYLEEAFLIKPLNKWSPSYKDRVYAQKKLYFYDVGIKTTLTGKGDLGPKIENLIFLELTKVHRNIGYYAESERELDFAYNSFNLPEGLEVKYDSSIDWQDKKLKGVKLFLRRYPKTRAVTIISKNVSKTLKKDGTAISIIPAWKYLLSAG